MSSSSYALGPLPRCSLGDLVGENDHELARYYIGNPHYECADDIKTRKFYYIGRKGFGKSAILQMLRIKKPSNRIVDLSNQDLGLDLLTLDQSLKQLPLTARNLLFRSAWKSALMVAIHQATGIDWNRFTRTEPQKAFDHMAKTVARVEGKVGILDSLQSLITQVRAEFEGKGLKIGMDFAIKQPDFTQKMAATAFFHQVKLAEEHLADLIKDQEVFVLIDDLDNNWKNEELQNEYLAALFHAVEKFARIPSLKFVISLRLDIFRKLPLENPDKVVQHIYRLNWTPPMLRQIIERRIEDAIGEPPARFNRRFKLDKATGNPLERVLVQCLPHPRDAIWTVQTLLDIGAERRTAEIDKDLIESAIKRASFDRVRFIINEWQHVIPWLPKVLGSLRGGVNVYAHDRLGDQIRSASPADIAEDEVLKGLLEAGVTGLKYRADGVPTYYFAEDPPNGPLGGNVYFEIHPSLRHAIQNGGW